MLSDSELREMRSRKKRQAAMATPAGRIALSGAQGKRSLQEIEKMLEPWTKGTTQPEPIMQIESDPVREILKKGGFVD